jgi:hypothetical protein
MLVIPTLGATTAAVADFWILGVHVAYGYAESDSRHCCQRVAGNKFNVTTWILVTHCVVRHHR